MTFQSYSLQIQREVEKMNTIFNTIEKRKYAAEKARLKLSNRTKSDCYSEAYAYLIKSIGLTTRIQDEYTQKLVVFYFYAQQVYFDNNSMLDDFVNNNGRLSNPFDSYH
jgi:hypothetical protein